jgi:type IV secretory pathway VirB3-like protein
MNLTKNTIAYLTQYIVVKKILIIIIEILEMLIIIELIALTMFATGMIIVIRKHTSPIYPIYHPSQTLKTLENNEIWGDSDFDKVLTRIN